MTATTTILRDQKVYFDYFDLTAQMNSVALAYSADQLDSTTLGNDTHVNTPSLKSVSASLAGLVDASTYDAGLFSEIGNTTGKPLTICSSGTIGSLAYFLKANAAKYNQDGKVGDLLKFSLEASAADKLIRGTLMENQAAVTATGNGTSRQLVATASGKKLYAALHVLSISGTSTPTLNMTVKSNSTNSFAGAETTRITFAAATAVGSQILSLDGPLTDTWFECEWTVTGTNPSFQFIVVVGVQ